MQSDGRSSSLYRNGGNAGEYGCWLHAGYSGWLQALKRKERPEGRSISETLSHFAWNEVDCWRCWIFGDRLAECVSHHFTTGHHAKMTIKCKAVISNRADELGEVVATYNDSPVTIAQEHGLGLAAHFSKRFFVCIKVMRPFNGTTTVDSEVRARLVVPLDQLCICRCCINFCHSCLLVGLRK